MLLEAKTNMEIKFSENSNAIEAGILYMVATPIGNMEDITLRALRILDGVDVIYTEDTRVSGLLLKRYAIEGKMKSLREASGSLVNDLKSLEVIDLLYQGKSVCYITDAGTPGISDPGSFLADRVWNAGFRVVPIPGPSALASLISLAGWRASSPLFMGFLPKKKGRQTSIKRLLSALYGGVSDMIVMYESPERIVKLLREIVEFNNKIASDSTSPRNDVTARSKATRQSHNNVLDLQVCVGRELTKLYEEVLRGDISEVMANLEKRAKIKGEIVLGLSLKKENKEEE